MIRLAESGIKAGSTHNINRRPRPGGVRVPPAGPTYVTRAPAPRWLAADRDLLLVEGDIAAVVLADPSEGGRVGLGVAPRRVVMRDAGHRDVVILGVALPRAVVRRGTIAERAVAERGGREVVVALDSNQVGVRGVRDHGAIDGGLHVLSLPKSDSYPQPRADPMASPQPGGGPVRSGRRRPRGAPGRARRA